MHEKQAKHTKTHAPMIRYCSLKQLTITEFDWPFQTVLDENNRWIKMSRCLPCDELAEFYYQGLSAETGRPAKDARIVIGAVIIKHKLGLSDVSTDSGKPVHAILRWSGRVSNGRFVRAFIMG